MGAAWPNLFIPGAPKAGTTALWHYLGEHPEIYMSPLKEPGFLARDPGGGGIHDEQSYLRLFAKASGEKWRGEASTAYFSDDSSPSRIKAVSPDSKIIISLRDPVERAYSDYWYYVRRNMEERSFREAVDQALPGHARAPRTGPVNHYVDRGFYVARLERYLSLFGENVLVLFQEELRGDASSELRKVCEFLDVDPGFAQDLSQEAQNEFELPRSWLGARLVRSPALLAVGRRLPKAPRRKVVKLVTVKSRKPKMDAETRELLRTLYEPECEPLQRLLARPLPW